jgi:prepilin peptidase CpaA
MIVYIILLALLVLCIISDIKTSKIKNIYVLSAAVAGMGINLYSQGMEGLIMSVWGLILPVVLLGIFFYTGLLGAGDIKLFSSIGALLGWQSGLYIMGYSFFAAGIFSLIKLLRTSELKRGFLFLGRDLKLFLYSRNFTDLQASDAKHIIKLSPYIAMGVGIQLAVNCTVFKL